MSNLKTASNSNLSSDDDVDFERPPCMSCTDCVVRGWRCTTTPAGEKDFLPKVRLCPIYCRNFRAPAVLPAAPPTQLLLRGATQRLVPARRDPQNPVTIPSAVSHPVLPGNAPPGGSRSLNASSCHAASVEQYNRVLALVLTGKGIEEAV